MSDEIIAAILGVLGGALTGSSAAAIAGRAQVKSLRLELAARKTEIETLRRNELDDQEHAANAEAQRDAEKMRVNLEGAAFDLIAALGERDSFKRLRNTAQASLRTAASEVPDDSPLKPMAQQLMSASARGDATGLQAVLDEMAKSTDRGQGQVSASGER